MMEKDIKGLNNDWKHIEVLKGLDNNGNISSYLLGRPCIFDHKPPLWRTAFHCLIPRTRLPTSLLNIVFDYLEILNPNTGTSRFWVLKNQERAAKNKKRKSSSGYKSFVTPPMDTVIQTFNQPPTQFGARYILTRTSEIVIQIPASVSFVPEVLRFIQE
jgi:hypothetical protein